MSTIETVELFSFEELSDRAKERARDWYREASMHDDWWDNVYDDFVEVCDRLGVNLKTHDVRLMNGKTRQEPNIWFSLSYSQGDGAAFDGTWYSGKDVDLVKKHAPNDEKLHAIAETLWRAHVACVFHGCPSVSAGITSDRDTSIRVDVEIDDSGDEDALEGVPFDQIEDWAKEALQDLASWLYDRLRDEYEYLTSDEVVDDNITANEYTFDEDGNREG